MSIIRPLGTLELAVMKVLWKKGEVTGKDAWKDINSARKAALTTVLTVMERLSLKGFIKKTRTENLFVYSPSITKDDYTKEISRVTLKDYMDLSSSSLIASFVDTLEEFEQDGIERLSAYIEKKRNESPKAPE